MPAALFSGTRRLVVGTLYYSGVAVRWTGSALWTAVTDPAAARAKLASIWKEVKHEAHHYWVGGKLFVAETRTSASLLRAVGRGKILTRRERLQLKRSLGDLLRMVPFVVILVVPFAEFALPVLLKLFPNMLPSQFEVCVCGCVCVWGGACREKAKSGWPLCGGFYCLCLFTHTFRCAHTHARPPTRAHTRSFPPARPLCRSPSTGRRCTASRST